MPQNPTAIGFSKTEKAEFCIFSRKQICHKSGDLPYNFDNYLIRKSSINCHAKLNLQKYNFTL